MCERETLFVPIYRDDSTLYSRATAPRLGVLAPEEDEAGGRYLAYVDLPFAEDRQGCRLAIAVQGEDRIVHMNYTGRYLCYLLQCVNLGSKVHQPSLYAKKTPCPYATMETLLQQQHCQVLIKVTISKW